MAPSTRDAILERSVALASLEGLEGLTIGRLSGELAMSKSGLFRHFGSKEELQLATVQRAAESFVREVVAPAGSLGELVERYLDHLERRTPPGGCFWAAAATEFDGRPGPVRDAVRDAVAAWLGELERRARQAGADDPRQLAFEVHAIVTGANTAHQLLGDEGAFARARTACARLLA